MLSQVGAILATGNRVLAGQGARGLLAGMPAAVAQRITFAADPLAVPHLDGALFEGERAALVACAQALAAREGAIVPLQGLTKAELAAGEAYELAWLVEECAVTTNTAAAGGNASLMAIG